MAQFSNTIGSLPVQQQVTPPPGWSKETGSGNIDVTLNAETQYSDRVLTFDTVGSPLDLTWDIPGVQDDSEILALMKFVGTNSGGIYYFSAAIRMQESIESGYYFGITPSNTTSGTTIRIGRLDNGNAGAAVTANFSWSNDTWYWIRLRAIGNTISAKMWQIGNAEPGAFQLSLVDGNYSVGRVGLRCRNNSIAPVVANFWVATDGDTAVKGNTLDGVASYALSSTLKATPGVRWGKNQAQLPLSSDFKQRFVSQPINITAVLATAATLRVVEWVPTRWTAEWAPTIQSTLTAKAFIPYKTLPRHYEGDHYVRRFADDYATAFNELLPTGPAWPREPETVLQRAVAGLSAIWGSVVEQLAELLLVRESDPRTTVILLSDWERAWGLPDKCLAELQTVADRQIALVHKMTMIGAQSREFFVGVAKSIGYDITIREWAPFMCGMSMCGDTRKLNVVEHVFTIPNFSIDTSFIQLDYNFDPINSKLNWTGTLATVTATASGITVVPIGTDPIIRSPAGLIIEGSTQRYIEIDVERTALRSIGAWQGQIYYTTSEHGESELFTKKFQEVDNTATGGGSRTTIVADMFDLTVGGTDWQASTITQIRIDFEDGQVGAVIPNGQFKIHSINIHSAPLDIVTPMASVIVLEDTDNYRWEIGKPEMRFFWSVRVGATKFTWFRASSGQAGVNHHLEFSLATDLECILRRWKPAHTEIIFDYSPMVALDFSKPFDMSYYMMMT